MRLGAQQLLVLLRSARISPCPPCICKGPPAGRRKYSPLCCTLLPPPSIRNNPQPLCIPLIIIYMISCLPASPSPTAPAPGRARGAPRAAINRYMAGALAPAASAPPPWDVLATPRGSNEAWLGRQHGVAAVYCCSSGSRCRRARHQWVPARPSGCHSAGRGAGGRVLPCDPTR